MVIKKWNGVGYRAFYTQDNWIHITDMNGIILCDISPEEHGSLEEALQGYIDFMSSQGQVYLH